MPGQRGGRTAGGTGLLPLRAVLPHALRTRECQFWPHCPALQNATSNISLAYVAPYTNASLDQVRRSGLPGTPAVLSPASIFFWRASDLPCSGIAGPGLSDGGSR